MLGSLQAMDLIRRFSDRRGAQTAADIAHTDTEIIVVVDTVFALFMSACFCVLLYLTERISADLKFGL